MHSPIYRYCGCMFESAIILWNHFNRLVLCFSSLLLNGCLSDLLGLCLNVRFLVILNLPLFIINGCSVVTGLVLGLALSWPCYPRWRILCCSTALLINYKLNWESKYWRLGRSLQLQQLMKYFNSNCQKETDTYL